MLRGKHLLVCVLLSLSACGGGGSDGGSDDFPNVPPTQGNRILGMDVKEVPSVTYAAAYGEAVALGVREVSVSLDWVGLEPTVGNYDDTLPGLIEAFYPTQSAYLTLVLRPLDTAGPRLPADLAGLPFDDPAVITAFENFLTHLYGQLSNMNSSGRLRWIHVGNEIDSDLGSDSVKWTQWQTFFSAAKTRIESLWGAGIEVSSVVQFGGLKNPAVLARYNNLLPLLDAAAVTYYPLDNDLTMRPTTEVAADFSYIVNTIGGKQILLQECGYASSAVNLSSEADQADFISAVFAAWDTHRARIDLIDFTWQYDVSEATADQWVIDYGMSGQPNENEFKHYLWSLGLHNHDSTEKLAWQRLRNEMVARDWIK